MFTYDYLITYLTIWNAQCGNPPGSTLNTPWMLLLPFAFDEVREEAIRSLFSLKTFFSTIFFVFFLFSHRTERMRNLFEFQNISLLILIMTVSHRVFQRGIRLPIKFGGPDLRQKGKNKKVFWSSNKNQSDIKKIFRIQIAPTKDLNQGSRPMPHVWMRKRDSNLELDQDQGPTLWPRLKTQRLRTRV